MLFLYILAQTGYLLLGLVYLAMLLRAILSWFVRDEESVIMAFLSMITEPVIMPIRYFLMRFRFVQQCPIDISFMVSFVVIVFVQQLLPVPAL